MLFQDDVFLVIDKPAGLPSHATPDPERPHAEEWVRSWLREAGMPDRAHLAHRLDAATSGVLVFVHDPANTETVTALFRSRAVEKQYYAICGRLADAPEQPPELVDNHLGPLRGRPARWGVVRSGGKRAITRVEVVASSPRCVHVRAFPATGRTHQIRVHLATSGFPILGDRLYATGLPPSAPSAARLMLHAQSLTLPHPLTGERMVWEAPLPAAFSDPRFQR